VTSNSQIPPLVEEKPPFKTRRSMERTKIWSCVPKGTETKDHCAGEDQEQFIGLDWPTISHRHDLFAAVNYEMVNSRQ
jgi:hypothetical protein